MWTMWWIACEPEPSPVDTAAPPECATADIEVTCGTWSDGAFVPLADGAPATMVHGPAGGWTLRFAVAADSIGPYATVHPTVTLDGVRIDTNNEPDERAFVYDAETCHGELEEVVAYLWPDKIDPEMTWLETICTLAGRTLEVQIDVTELVPPGGTTTPSTSGRRGSCAVEVAAQLDPEDVPLCEAL